MSGQSHLVTRLRGAGLAIALVVVLAGLVGVPAGPAWAHVQLLSSTPAAGSTVEQAPHQIVLEFTDDLLDLSQDVIVTTPTGDRLTGLDVSVAGPRAIAALPDGLGPGAYTVTWRVVSRDGHPIEGRFAFSIAGVGPATRPPTTSTATTSEPTPAGWSSSGPAWAWVVVAVVLVGAASMLVRRRRRS